MRIEITGIHLSNLSCSGSCVKASVWRRLRAWKGICRRQAGEESATSGTVRGSSRQKHGTVPFSRDGIIEAWIAGRTCSTTLTIAALGNVTTIRKCGVRQLIVDMGRESRGDK